MFNPALKAYRNLQTSSEDKPKKPTGGLLARGMTPKKDTNNMEPRDRIANYVAEIRKVRQGLKNG